jgi:PhnB protein
LYDALDFSTDHDDGGGQTRESLSRIASTSAADAGLDPARFAHQVRRVFKNAEAWHIDVQRNESQATRMTNSNMSVQPYLFFNGRCEEALEFYNSAVGAEVEMLSRFKDAPEPGMTQPGMEDKVMHASFRIGETILMASDGRCEGEPRFEGFSLSIIVPDEKKAESVFNALADGGKVTMPLEKTFWAPKFGMLEDQFGVGWMVSVQHKP